MLKLNDAAFDLSNGPVADECGEELGDILLNWLKSWEQADTLTSRTLPHDHAFGDLALGRRLSSAGRRFQSMGPYGQGNLAKIAKIMIATGKRLAATQVSAAMVEEPKKEARTFKSLRGALLATGYSSAILSTIASFGVRVLARQLKSENK
ncbi:hypothetical protein EUGRSUZ_H04102 [Eucalyptus grandis]|uniref:Uncharacterized protein n=2 Tax=Eucalyptus grandis TaxID=71139 RepID=A0A059B5P9_EUCGR|nr:hypothetical protein EUGRSUZ_H04102 [Eucalyptus grandis]